MLWQALWSKVLREDKRVPSSFSYIQPLLKTFTTCWQSLSKLTISKPLDIARRRACFKAVDSYSEVVLRKKKSLYDFGQRCPSYLERKLRCQTSSHSWMEAVCELRLIYLRLSFYRCPSTFDSRSCFLDSDGPITFDSRSGVSV
jgi:hypothetical protein